MKNIKTVLAAVLAVASLGAQAQSVHDSSQASALSTAGLSAAVAFVPLSVVIGGSALVGMTFEHLSRLLSEETEWIVDEVKGKGHRTELRLKARKQQAVMIVGVPTQPVVNNHVQVNNYVQFQRLGDQSFALKQGNATIGVMTNADATLSHSVKK